MHRKVLFVVVLLLLLPPGLVSLAAGQSAEELAKSEKGGVKYTWIDNDAPHYCYTSTRTVEIRGNSITYSLRYDSINDPSGTPADARIGVWQTLESARVNKNYREGNRLVLETDGNIYLHITQAIKLFPSSERNPLKMNCLAL